MLNRTPGSIVCWRAAATTLSTRCRATTACAAVTRLSRGDDVVNALQGNDCVRGGDAPVAR
jgi:hypothetical protein